MYCSRKDPIFGLIISKQEVEMDKKKWAAVEKKRSPSSWKVVRAVLGLVGFSTKFVLDSRRKLETPCQLLKLDKKFFWKKECEQTLHELKEKLLSASILEYPNNRDEYTLTTGGPSFNGNGEILTEKQEGVDRLIAYANTTLTQSQRNYSATEGEAFTVVQFTNQSETYLLGWKFVVIRDHRALVWLYGSKDSEGMVAKWLEKMGQFDLELRHNAGKEILREECLSRVQVQERNITKFVVTLKKARLEIRSRQLIHGNYFKTLTAKAWNWNKQNKV